MNVHFCSLGMKTYRFQLVKFTMQEQLLSLKSLFETKLASNAFD